MADRAVGLTFRVIATSPLTRPKWQHAQYWPYKITAWAESVIESMLYILWDLKLKVGHSSRTVKDCLRLGAEDFTIRTAMLEHRFLVGHEPLADDLDGKLWKTLFRGTEVEFVEAKLAERDARHVKQGQRYMVEPNVKEGKGGLRDLQSLFWIAKYIHHTDDLGKLVRAGVFQPEEFDTFVKAENFLWAVRCHLHLASGRATEQLTFDMQVEVADRMGYVDKGGRRGVEIFMRVFFRRCLNRDPDLWQRNRRLCAAKRAWIRTVLK